MSNETLFFICGIALAVSAVSFSVIGLKVRDFPGRAFPAVVLWFAILVGGATTFAVLHGKDEEKAKAAELEKAGKEFEAEGADSQAAAQPATGEGEGKAEAGGGEAEAAAKGPGGTVQLEASPTEIAYNTTKLASKPGKVTIDFTNPAMLEHDVAIEGENGKQIAVSKLIGKGKTSVSANLAPGAYTFFCTVPGHREAGMEGTLTVR
jgi:plastocyanin